MSTYFQNFPNVAYNFGNNIPAVAWQNLSAYVDVIDQIKDNVSFYRNYYIQEGDRPDQVSYQLYNTTDYYWTFFLLNDKLREQGWPLSYDSLSKLADKTFPNTVVETRNDLTGIFKVGQTVTGSTSAETGTIIERRLDLGQIVIQGTKSFNQNEVLTSQVVEDVQSISIISSVSEKLATRYWVDSNKKQRDINPFNARPTSSAYAVPVSNFDYYVEKNDELKEIKVLKPDVARDVFGEYQDKFLNG